MTTAGMRSGAATKVAAIGLLLGGLGGLLGVAPGCGTSPARGGAESRSADSGAAGAATGPYAQHVERIELNEAQRSALAIDVQNALGIVEIDVDPRLASATVAWRAFPSPNGESLRTRQGPPGWIATDLTEDAGLPVLRVLAGAPDGATAAMRVRISVPACAGVRVRNAGGLVRIAGTSGAVDVSNGHGGGGGGPIDVRTAGAQTQPATLLTTQGDVRLEIGAGSQGDLIASADGGVVRVDAPKAKLVTTTALKGRVVGTLGGENRLELHSAGGNVDLVIRR